MSDLSAAETAGCIVLVRLHLGVKNEKRMPHAAHQFQFSGVGAYSERFALRPAGRCHVSGGGK